MWHTLLNLPEVLIHNPVVRRLTRSPTPPLKNPAGATGLCAYNDHGSILTKGSVSC